MKKRGGLTKKVSLEIADFCFYVSDAVHYIWKKSSRSIKSHHKRKEFITFKFIKKTTKSLIKDVKDIFTISDELIKEGYRDLRYNEIIKRLKHNADKLSVEIQYKDYKKVEQKLKDIRLSFYKIPRVIRNKEKDFEEQLNKLEQSIEIGFLVDEAIMRLKAGKLKKAKDLLHTVSHYAFIPDGIISEKYFSCSNYCEHFLLKEQYASYFKKVKLALENKKLRSSIENYEKFVETSQKLNKHEGFEGKQIIYNDINFLQEKIHFLSASKIRPAKFFLR